MPDQNELEELVAYLVRSSRLSAAEATRLVNEVLAFSTRRPRTSSAAATWRCRRRASRTARSSRRSPPSSTQRRFRAPALTRAADPAGHLRLNGRLAQCAESSVTSASATRRRSSWKDCIGWNIAATTRRASPARATASCSVHKSKGKVRDWSARCRSSCKGTPASRTRAGRRTASRAIATRIRTATPRAVSPSSTTASSRTRRSCARSWKRGGVMFQSETDSEVLAHLIAAMPADTLEDAVRAALRLVTGTYGLAVLDAAAARNRSSSRATAARSCSASATRDVRRVRSGGAGAPHAERRAPRRRRDRRGARRRLRDLDARRRRHGEDAARPSTWTDESFDKGGFAHYMRKEIAEQPEAIRRTLSGRLDPRFQTTHIGGLEMAARELLEIRRVKILGCGSAYIAGCDRRAPHRAARAHSGACGAGLGVSLPQSGHRAGHAVRRRQPVRRDVRHARRRAGSEAQRRSRARHRQRRRQHYRARMRSRHLSACRARDRGRLDQDVHVTLVAFALLAIHLGPHARSVDRARRASDRGARSAARPSRADPRDSETRSRPSRGD